MDAIHVEQTETVFEGQSAAAFDVKPENIVASWQIESRTDKGIERTGYRTLRCALHLGTSKARIGPRLNVFIGGDAPVDIVREEKLDLEVDVWQTVDIPLEEDSAAGPIRSIIFSGNLEGTFYLDAVRLVAAEAPEITVILEDHTDTEPQTFTLDQNYPNPFNSGTVIPFGLEASSNVTLSVYNLAGQKVAMLIDGQRQAGAYNVHWDGKDDRQNTLATGMYFYRLQAGDRIETKKLLLLR